MSIIYYESPAATFSKENGEYQLEANAIEGYLISGIEITDERPSENADWAPVAYEGSEEGSGTLNTGKYQTVQADITVNGSDLNYRIQSVPIAYTVTLHRNYDNADTMVAYKYTNHDLNRIPAGDITIEQGGVQVTYVFLMDNAPIYFPQSWSYPSGYNIFAGWNTASDGSGVTVTDLSNINADTDLYAIYGIQLKSPSIKWEGEVDPDTGLGKSFVMQTNNPDLPNTQIFYWYIPVDIDPRLYQNPPVEIPHEVNPLTDSIKAYCQLGNNYSEPIEIAIRDIVFDSWRP